MSIPNSMVVSGQETSRLNVFSYRATQASGTLRQSLDEITSILVYLRGRSLRRSQMCILKNLSFHLNVVTFVKKRQKIAVVATCFEYPSSLRSRVIGCLSRYRKDDKDRGRTKSFPNTITYLQPNGTLYNPIQRISLE